MGKGPGPVGSHPLAIVAIATIAYLLLTFSWFSLPAFLTPIIRELGLTSTQAGIVVGAVPLTYIPLALFTGLFVDRVGPGRSLALGVACYGVGQLGRSFATGFPSLLAFTLLIGVGATAITFGLPKLVAVLFPSSKTGFPSAVYLLGASLGSATVFAIGRPVLGPWLGGWRGVFFASGALAIGFAIAWLGLALRLDLDGSARADQPPMDLAAMHGALRTVLTHRELQLLVVIGTMYLFVTHGVQGWLPTVLEGRGLSTSLAGLTTSGFVLAMATGVFVVPSLGDRLGKRPTALVGCGGLIVIGAAGLVGAPTSWVAVVVLITGFGVGGISPLLRAIPPALVGIGPRLTGTAIGFIFAVGEIGGFLGPVLIGWLHERTGSFLPGLTLLVIAGLVVILSGESLRRVTARRKAPPGEPHS